jgi:hypothetical protein
LLSGPAAENIVGQQEPSRLQKARLTLLELRIQK